MKEQTLRTDNTRMKNSRDKAIVLVKLGMMAAVAIIIGLQRIPLVPAVPFLTYDLADIPILVTTFAFGVIPGMLVLVVVSFIQAFLLGGDSVYGFIMHIIASGSFLLVAGLIYRVNKTKKTAATSMAIATAVMVVVMLGANYFVTPLFMGAPKEAVVALFPYIGLFNLIKGVLNSIITFVVYKKISKFLHGEGIVKAGKEQLS